MTMKTALLSVLLTLCSAAFAQQGGNSVVTNSVNAGSIGGTTPGTGAFTSVNSRLFADLYAGSDCGAKVNAALTALDGPGNVEMTPACGNITTAITLGSNQHLFARPGTYNQSAIITVGFNASVQCDPDSDVPGTAEGTCYFSQPNSTNLAEMFFLDNDDAALVNVTVFGNGANNSTAGPNILITGLRSRLSHVNSENAKTNGVYVGASATTANVGAASKLDHVMILDNLGDGVKCSSSSDLFIGDESEIENNGGNGINLYDCGGARIQFTDISGNTLDGLYNSGISTGVISGYNIQINSNVFSNQYENDIEIQGWDSSAGTWSSRFNGIVGNIFQGSENHGGNTYDAIKIQDSGDNTINGNTVMDINGSTYEFHAGVQIIQTHTENPDNISGNTLSTPVNPIIALANTQQCGNTVNEQPSICTGYSFASTGTTFTMTGCSETGLTGGPSSGYFTAGLATCYAEITGLTGPPGTAAWVGYASDLTTTTDTLKQIGTSSTTCEFEGTVLVGDLILFHCEPIVVY
jgi:hypothetical protein